MRTNWIFHVRLLAALLTVAAPLIASAADPPANKGTRRSPGSNRVVQQGKDAVKRMSDTVQKMQRTRDGAKAAGDLIKLNYVNAKLAKAQSQLREAEQSLGDLNTAATANDSAEASFQLARINIFSEQIAALGAEAERSSSSSVYNNSNSVEVEVDPSIPASDPTELGLPTPLIVMPPPGIEQASSDSPFFNNQSPL